MEHCAGAAGLKTQLHLGYEQTRVAMTTAPRNADELVISDGLIQGGIDRAQLIFAISGIVTAGNAAPVMKYRRTGDAFSPDHFQYGQVVEVGGSVTVRFVLPGRAHVDFLQFEIPAIPGLYRIEAVQLQNVLVADLSRRVMVVEGRLLSGASQTQVRYASDRGRPCLEIDVRDIASMQLPKLDLFVDVVIRKEDAVAETAAALDKRLDVLSAQLGQSSRETSQTAFGHGQELRRQSDRLRQQSREMSEEFRSQSDRQKAQAAGLAETTQMVELLTKKQQSLHEQFRRLSEQLLALNLNHSKGIATTQGYLQETLDQVKQLKFAMENVFWRRWLRRLRGSQK